MCSWRWARPRRAARRIPLWGGQDAGGARLCARRYNNRHRVGQVDFSYPALAQEQPGRDNGGWPEVKVDYAAVADAAGARVAARLPDGTPFVLDKQIGEDIFSCLPRVSTI